LTYNKKGGKTYECLDIRSIPIPETCSIECMPVWLKCDNTGFENKIL